MKKFLIPLLLVIFFAACAGSSVKTEPAKGVYHQVKKGETLYSISKAYRADLQEVAELNNITNPAAIEAGDAIFIPGAEKIVEVPIPEPRDGREHREPIAKKPPKPPPAPTPAQPAPQASSTPKKIRKSDTAHASAVRPVKEPSVVEKSPPAKPAPPPAPRPEEPKVQVKTEKPPDPDRVEFDRKRFIWPIKGTILSRYGIQPNGSKNNGIRIAAGENTPVLAAAAGEVTYSDTLKYYGDTVILRHDDNFSTVYTSLKGRSVKVGDRVKKGDKIALLGKNDAGQIFLNFEIRQVNKPRNPLFFLP